MRKDTSRRGCCVIFPGPKTRPLAQPTPRLGGRGSAAQPRLRPGATIDQLNGELSPLRFFVLPGGSPAAAALHLARTVCRRAERLVVALAEKPGETVSPAALKYLNRLSDFLFVASRYVNDRGARDVLWAPGKTRGES